MTRLIIERRLRRAKQRMREKYEAVKARAERNDREVENLHARFKELVSKHEEYVRLTNAQNTDPSKDEREHRDNERSMTRSTKIISRFTVVLAFVGAIGALIAWRTLDAIQGQLDAMQSDQRPWVKLKSFDLSSAVALNGGRPRFNVTYSLENVGHSVALRATIFFLAYVKYESGSYQGGPTNTSLDDLIVNYVRPELILNEYNMGRDLDRICDRRFEAVMREEPAKAVKTNALANTIFPNDTVGREIPIIADGAT